MTAGYSGKPLAEKLGVRDGDTLAVMDAPAHYAALVEPFVPACIAEGAA